MTGNPFARLRSWFVRRIVYPVEAGTLYAAWLVMGALPVDLNSAVWGALGRTIGPLLPVSRRARRNIARAFPDMSPKEIREVVRGMWDNVGRVVGEWPSLASLWDDDLREQVLSTGVDRIRALSAEERPLVVRGRRIEIVGAENFIDMLDRGGPALYFSAHYGNWEISPLGAARFGLPVAVVFRAPNNPYVLPLLRRFRRGMGEMLAKGPAGAIATGRVLERGGRVGMLVDQKYNRGIPIPFFGRPAMTSPALAKLAWHFRCPVYGIRVERTGGAHFRVTIEPPTPLPRTENEKAFVVELMTRITGIVERWIRERPEQWLWLHRRWPD